MPVPAPPSPGRIRRRSTFGALRRPEGRARRGPVAAAWVPGTEEAPPTKTLVGYAVSRRCGGAVARNRLRRRLRAAVSEATAAGVPAGSFLVRPDPAAADLGHRQLVAHVTEVLRASGGAPESPR